MQLPDSFAHRHLGTTADHAGMLEKLGFSSLDALVDAAIPANIRRPTPLHLPAAATETEALGELKRIMSANKLCRSYIGMGYYDCIAPPVIQRNIL